MCFYETGEIEKPKTGNARETRYQNERDKAMVSGLSRLVWLELKTLNILLSLPFPSMQLLPQSSHPLRADRMITTVKAFLAMRLVTVRSGRARVRLGEPGTTFLHRIKAIGPPFPERNIFLDAFPKGFQAITAGRCGIYGAIRALFHSLFTAGFTGFPILPELDGCTGIPPSIC
jgi:hypothetical protein